MNRIIKYLKQPFPMIHKPWLVILVTTLIIFFLLMLLLPLNQNVGYSRWFIVIGFTGVTSLSIFLIGYIFPLIFKKFYSYEKWTIGRNLLNVIFIILVISIGNFIFDIIIFDRAISTYFIVFRSYLITTIILGLIPATLITFINNNLYLKYSLREAKELNKKIIDDLNTKNLSENTDEHIIKLTGSTKENLEINPKNIIYIEASGNYVKIIYVDNEKIQQKLIRTTISKIESDLNNCISIIRCHRAFLVNINYIINIDGNSQGLLLNLDNIKEQIPVSRNYIKTIREKIK